MGMPNVQKTSVQCAEDNGHAQCAVSAKLCEETGNRMLSTLIKSDAANGDFYEHRKSSSTALALFSHMRSSKQCGHDLWHRNAGARQTDIP